MAQSQWGGGGNKKQRNEWQLKNILRVYRWLCLDNKGDRQVEQVTIQRVGWSDKLHASPADFTSHTANT